MGRQLIGNLILVTSYLTAAYFFFIIIYTLTMRKVIILLALLMVVHSALQDYTWDYTLFSDHTDGIAYPVGKLTS